MTWPHLKLFYNIILSLNHIGVSFELFLELLPVLEHHFEFFEKQTVGQSISPRSEFHLIVSVRIVYFDFSVQMDSPPSLFLYFTSNEAARANLRFRMINGFHGCSNRRKANDTTRNDYEITLNPFFIFY